ncbi:hypothetical protein [Aureimonas sp. Leaf324]|jgi:hypothetical protein|uniref:hypothetical protein n=1 Tax=Aureimonas sp. Leaf324 TaxID=1736336 RepID=UPI0006FA9A4A|nr:hypothetical protein [Aureimonas sp. Leaf324]KQQ85726.1 hypothetical protein ASF65_04035 [Aureimonas sp. Leaf324]
MQHCDLVYCVERLPGYWTVTFCGSANGRFGTRREALHSAASDARRVEQLGHTVCIEVSRPRNRYRLSERRFHLR